MLQSLIIVLCVSICFAATAVEECEVAGIKFKVGETISIPGKCQDAECVAGGGIRGKGCGVSQPNPELDCVEIPTDYSKPFPQCCPRWDCKPKSK